jgi:hypothetical protein
MARVKRPVKWTAGAVFLALAAAGLFAVAIYLTVSEYQLGANGVPAVGTVTQYEKRGRTVLWTVSYPHQGQTVSATVEPSMFSGLELGREVKILYDPKNPQTINVDNFWHRYFYPTLFFAGAALLAGVLPMMLRQSDETWLREYALKVGAMPAETLTRADQFVSKFWLFHLSTATASPRGALASYFRTYGPDAWTALKAVWDADAVPSFGKVVAEIDRLIADGDPNRALTDASPGLEQFYYPLGRAILSELRDHITDPNRAARG